MPNKSFQIFCLIFITISFSLAATPALIPAIAKYFEVPPQQALYLTWLYMLPYSIFSFIWGPLTSRVTVKKLLLFAALGFSISLLCLGLSQNISQAFIMQFLSGIFGSAFIPLAFITIGKTIAATQKAKYLGLFFAASTLSSSTGVLVGGFISWRAVYLVPAFLSLLIFIVTLLLLDNFDFRRERFSISYLSTFSNKEALKLFFVIGLGSFIFHSLQQNLGVYLSQKLNFPQPIISGIFAISTLSAIIARFSAGLFTSYVGTIKMVRLGFMLMSIFSASMIILSGYKLLYFLVVFWGFGWAVSHIGLSVYLASLPDALLRDASGFNSALRMGIGGLGAIFGGLVIQTSFGFRLFFLFLALSCIGLSLFTGKLLSEQAV